MYSIRELHGGWAVHLDGKRVSRKIHGQRMDAQREMLHLLRCVGVIFDSDDGHSWDIWEDAVNDLCDG